MKKTTFILLLTLLLFPLFSEGQCAMCRAVLESGDEQEVAKGINNGIIYLMAVPYILVALLAYILYKKFKN